MKNIIMVVFVLLFSSVALAKSNMGEWRVISVNCPNILVEKDGKREVFRYTEYRPMLLPDRVKACEKVKKGWVMVVKGSGMYYFFPPTSLNQEKR